MFRSTTIIREHVLHLAKVIFMLKHSVKLRRYTGWRKKSACPLAPTLTRFICLRFLSLGLPQIKSLRSKTSYS